MNPGTGIRLWRTVLPVLLTLQGCATAPSVPLEVDPLAVQRLAAWRLEGRVAVQTAADAWSASLVWQHDSESDHLALSGPMQQRAATILARENFVSYRSADGTDIVASDADALLREKVGIAIPLGVLRYWVLGIPAPDYEATPDTDGEDARNFSQSGWTLRYGDYLPAAELRLPRKLTATGEGMKLKLVVDEWQIQ